MASNAILIASCVAVCFVKAVPPIPTEEEASSVEDDLAKCCRIGRDWAEDGDGGQCEEFPEQAAAIVAFKHMVGDETH